MNPIEEVVVLTEHSAPRPTTERVQAMKVLCEQLMAVAVEQGDAAVALNGLLGAYITLAVQPPKDSGVSTRKAINALRIAADTVTIDALPTPAEADEAQALEARINNLLDGSNHSAALTALINPFLNAALQYTCCTAVAAEVCGKVHRELTAAAASCPPAPHLH